MLKCTENYKTYISSKTYMSSKTRGVNLRSNRLGSRRITVRSMFTLNGRLFIKDTFLDYTSHDKSANHSDTESL